MEEFLESLRPHLLDLISVLVTIAVAFAIYVVGSRVARVLAERRNASKLATEILLKWFRIFVVFAAVLVGLDQLGLMNNVWVFLSTLLGMFAVGLVAVWSVLSNGLCTLMLLIFQPFRVGDRVTLIGDDVSGKVIDINMMFTTLLVNESEVIRVPNNLFFQKAIQRRRGSERVDLDEQLQRTEPTT